MGTGRTRNQLLEMAAKAGLDVDRVRELAKPAAQLIVTEGEPGLGASRIGGYPDLPPDLPWPRCDVRAYAAKELENAQTLARKAGTDRGRRRAEELERRGERDPLPLTFLAQLHLQDLAGLDHGLPLPSSGHLLFFLELSEEPWGYCPTHRGSFRVIHAAAGAQLERCEGPEDLDEHVLDGAPIRVVQTWTVPSWPEKDDDAKRDAHFELIEAMKDVSPASEHQMGGHPDEIQGDMGVACALVSQGVYLGGGRPGVAGDELARLEEDAPNWRLLLQLSSDDDLGWMWGDAGNLYWWMREDDIRAGNWDAAWFQLQCS